MADIDVRNRTSSQSEQPEGGLQRQSRSGSLSPSSQWDPFSFSPSEFFSSPFSVMRRMSDEMDRVFGRFLGMGSAESMAGFPAVEVAEHDGNLCVHADLPGMKPEDVKVEVTEDSLIIRGERKSEHEHKGPNMYRSERQYGEFYRQIPLPQGANAEQAKASFNNGVLEISVPVPQQASKRREIPVQAGASGTATQRSEASAAAAAAGGGRSTSEKR
jgi:HSP20 family protein